MATTSTTTARRTPPRVGKAQANKTALRTIVRFADGRIAECWNLPAEVEAVASEDTAR